MNNNFSSIVFDLGNVLIPFDYNRIVSNLNLIEEGLGEHFYQIYLKNYEIHRKYERWELSDKEFIDIMLGWLDYKISAEEFCQIYADLFTVNNDVVSLLPRLKKKYKLVLLSNTNYIHQKYGWGKYEFLSYFDKLVLSHEVGATKPEPAIYKAVERFTKKPSREHIFIDDIEEYVKAAIDLGWDGIVFRGIEDLITNLRSRNIL